MNSTPTPYPSCHGNFGEQKGLEWMIDDGAYRHTTISGLEPSSQFEPYPEWVSQQLDYLMAVRAHIETKLWELQDLYRKQQDTLARLRAFNATTTTSTWNIPPQPTTSTSSSTAPYAQTVPHLLPVYTADNCAGKKPFGNDPNEASRMGEVTWHREALEHAKKSHICHCGKGYTRKDSLLRHAAIHSQAENPYI